MQVILKFVEINDPDLRQLVGMLDAYFYANWGETAGNYTQYHHLDDMSCAVVAYADGKAVGCGCWKSYDAVTAEIKRMFVQPDYRRERVATQIMHALEQHAASSGCHKAVLETGAEMTDAITFYEKQGYRLISNYGVFVDDEICVCMAKDIAQGAGR